MYPHKKAPPVWAWYRAFCIAAGLGFLGVTWLGWNMFSRQQDFANDLVSTPMVAGTGLFLIAAGLFIAVSNVALAFAPVRPAAWSAHLGSLILASCTCVMTPFSLLLLLYWLRPETKEFFGVE